MDFLAGLLGMKKVGWIFTQSKQERDFIMHTVREQPQRLWAVFLYETAQGGNQPPPSLWDPPQGELLQTAAMQDEIGETCATVMVRL